MKRILSILTIGLLTTGFMFSQGLDWGNFEGPDTSIWTNGWGGNQPQIVDNPFPGPGNTSSKVLMYVPTGGWQGISHWFMNGVLDSTHTSISLDVYTDSAANIQLSLVNSVDSAAEVFIKDTIIPKKWNHIVFDLSNLPAYDYQNIAFNNNEVVTYYFDNIRVNTASAEDSSWTRLDVKKVVFGTVNDSMDFSAHVLLKWTPDTFHMIFHVLDDSIVTTGATYQVDNIELYIDMDNSKRVHWPRNGGWQANDTTFDKNDFQLRLIPGMEWNYTTENQKLGGVNYTYSIDSAGYSFHVSIPWDSLMTGFMPDSGKLIGFDLLISDNDAVASDANRNQITYYSPTIYPFNDPSLWATLMLDSAGPFTFVPDTIRPDAPTNVTATTSGANVTLTWDLATDNIVVQQYAILQDSVAIDTVLAKKTKNTVTIKNLANGTYNFAVVSMDIAGNVSDTSAVDSITVAGVNVKTTNIFGLKLYPNPTDQLLTISNIEGTADIKIYNATGQLVLEQTVSNNDRINVRSFTKGIYSVEITNKGKTDVVKVIKK